jgi:hypothetical protein
MTEAPAATPPASAAPPSAARPEVSTASAGEAAEPTAIPQLRRHDTTRYGGVLFLHHILSALELPDEIASSPALAARSVRWRLHQLALTLVPAEPDDSAALAFAGLLPRDVPPTRGETAPNESERATLDAFAARIAEKLKERLEDPAPPDILLWSVCRRNAEIVADPGWIDVHLSLSDVSTQIRRAGLDLDPGYLPWLGVVVKFIYD